MSYTETGVMVRQGFPAVLVNGRWYALAGKNYRQFEELPHIWVSDTGDLWDDQRKLVPAQFLDANGQWRVHLKYRMRKYAVLVKQLRIRVHGA